MRKLLATLTVFALVTAAAIVSAQQVSKSKPASAPRQQVKVTQDQVKKAPGSPTATSKKSVVKNRLSRLERRAARVADRMSRVGARIERRLHRAADKLSRIPDRVADRLSRIPARLERALDRLI